MVKNKLIRLAELIQENYPENIMTVFKSKLKTSIAQRLALTSAVIAYHQRRSEALWLKAGKKRTAEERRAAAQAELASFVFAYLSGDGKEYVDSGIEALWSLGRQGEIELVKSLARR